MQPIPPKVRQEPAVLVEHGHTRIDPYYWLNQRENPEVLAYLQAENAYLQAEMAHTARLQETLFEEIVSRIPQNDQSVPYLERGYLYFSRYEAGLEYPVYLRKKDAPDAPEEVLLNVNELAEGKAYYQVGERSISPDNSILAFGEDTLGRRVYTLRFLDLATGQFLEDSLPETTGLAVWAQDGRHVFYTAKDPQTLRGYKIMRHVLGTPAEEDSTVFHESDETFDAHIYLSKSRKFLLILSSQTICQEFRILEANRPDGEFRIFHPRERGLEHHIFHHNDCFYIRTNLDARNFRLMVTPEGHTEKSNWREVVPHREDVLLEDVEEFRDFLVLSERQRGITQMQVLELGGSSHYIAFPEAVYLASTSVNLAFDSDVLRLSYQSLTTPVSTFDYPLRTREMRLLKQEAVLGGFDPGHYESERIYVPARDGVQVPVSIVYRKGFAKDGSRPLLLYGYGSYGLSMDPYFSISRLSLLDRGFAFAIAHVRGGEELGRAWYEGGKLFKKRNTFYDFIDCAEFLIAHGYTSPGHLYGMGGSAGGLLMGAVVNLRPDLWNGIVAAVPFVDVTTTMLDESIPLTTFEFDEWGNPKDKSFYEYMLSYSPYDNVARQDYPAMLVTTGLHDSQVQYWEPAKWVAKLRELKTDSNPLYLYTNMDTGHSGATGRFERYREIALEYGFLLDREARLS